MAFGANLVGGLGREVGTLELGALQVDQLHERLVELAQQRHPLALAGGDLIEVVLHARREVVVDEIAEVLDQQVRHDLAHVLRPKPALDDAYVATVGDRRDRRRIG